VSFHRSKSSEVQGCISAPRIPHQRWMALWKPLFSPLPPKTGRPWRPIERRLPPSGGMGSLMRRVSIMPGCSELHALFFSTELNGGCEDVEVVFVGEDRQSCYGGGRYKAEVLGVFAMRLAAGSLGSPPHLNGSWNFQSSVFPSRSLGTRRSWSFGTGEFPSRSLGTRGTR